MRDIYSLNTSQLTILLERARRQFMIAIERHRPSHELSDLRERIVKLESLIGQKDKRYQLISQQLYVA